MPTPPGRPNPAEYRMLAEAKKNEKLFAWLKEKYLKGKDEYDADIKQKLDEFKADVPEEKLNNPDNQDLIKILMRQYIEEYLRKDYREPIRVFFEKMGHGWFFDKSAKAPDAQELALVVKETKPAKADAKTEKEKAKDAKAEAKATKEKEREDAKAAEKAAKEKEREEARAARQKEKDDAKLAREQARAEKKTSKKAEVSAKIAIIVPFRDSEEGKPRTAQLNEFVAYMETYLSGHEYKIFVIEQSEDGKKFNRGQLLNIGFDLAKKEGYNNFVFHDVDLLPSEELKKYYTTIPTNNPIHIAAVWDRYGSNPKYFGGIVAFSKELFEKINGYPNNFWGWGGEDDELYNRTKKFSRIVKAKEGSIRDLENLNLEEKLEYLRENELKFMKKREALSQHEATWETNGLNEIDDIKILKRDPCGAN
jgi:hypothetical protein